MLLIPITTLSMRASIIVDVLNVAILIMDT